MKVYCNLTEPIEYRVVYSRPGRKGVKKTKWNRILILKYNFLEALEEADRVQTNEFYPETNRSRLNRGSCIQFLNTFFNRKLQFCPHMGVSKLFAFIRRCLIDELSLLCMPLTDVPLLTVKLFPQALNFVYIAWKLALLKRSFFCSPVSVSLLFSLNILQLAVARCIVVDDITVTLKFSNNLYLPGDWLIGLSK